MSTAPGGYPRGDGARVDRWLRELRRAVAWRRRLLAAGLLAGSTAFALQALAPPPPEGVDVLVAAREVATGGQLQPGDLRVVRRAAGTVPQGALTAIGQASGRSVTSAVRRGELLTDVRLAGPSALRGLAPDLVATPVRIADPDVVSLIRAGDVVDVLAAGADVGSGAGQARVVAASARVIAVPVPGRGATSAFVVGTGGGALLLLATSPTTAGRLAAATVGEQLSIVLRHY